MSRSHAPAGRSVRRALGALAVLLPLCAGACRDAPRSAAADVPDVDIRRLPPDRKKALPDVMVQAADRGRLQGSDTARAELLFVADYECPACRAWMTTVLPALQQAYVATGQLRVTFVHYPLRVHPVAVRAASAALCASAQGKFWEATSRLYATQDLWRVVPQEGRVDEALVAAAKARVDSIVRTSGVAAEPLDACIQTGRMLRQVHLDIRYADQNGLGGVPRIQIGTRRLDETASLATLRAVIDSTLAGK